MKLIRRGTISQFVSVDTYAYPAIPVKNRYHTQLENRQDKGDPDFFELLYNFEIQTLLQSRNKYKKKNISFDNLQR